MEPALLELIAEKDARGEVFFLKRDDLPYEGYPGPEDPGAYARASAWLEGVGVGAGPLLLRDDWWKREWRAEGARHCKDAARVVRNYRGGFHEYDELMELLQQSYGGALVPKCGWAE